MLRTSKRPSFLTFASAKDAIARENLEGPWVNILAVREEDKDKPWVKQLVEAYHSPAVKAFLEKRFAGTYIATW